MASSIADAIGIVSQRVNNDVCREVGRLERLAADGGYISPESSSDLDLREAIARLNNARHALLANAAGERERAVA